MASPTVSSYPISLYAIRHIRLSHQYHQSPTPKKEDLYTCIVRKIMFITLLYPLNIEGKNPKLNDIILSESSNTEFATLEQKFVAYF